MYYGRINASPEILNNFVAPNMESVDLKKLMRCYGFVT